MILFISLLQSKIVKEFVPKKIEHEHQFDINLRINVKAPAKGGGHISYSLIKCQGNCGKAIVAPEENFDLCTDNHRVKMIEVLKENGLSLIKNC